MRYLRYVFLGGLGIALLVVALANRGPVTLRLLPDEMAAITGTPNQVTLPLFVVIFAGIVAGLIIGFVWEWLREHKHRAEAVAAKREAAKLEREVKRMRKADPGVDDDVLALLDSPSKSA